MRSPPVLPRPGSGLFACAVGLTLAAAAGPLKAQPRFRATLQVDQATYDADVTPLSDGFAVRRARYGAFGSLDARWSYMAEVDVSSGRVGWADAYLRRAGVAGGRLTVGHQKVPFSIEELTGSSATTFMERASPVVFAPARRVGARWDRIRETHTLSAMGFGAAILPSADAHRGFGAGGRATFAPVHSGAQVVHLGAAAVRLGPQRPADGTVRLRQRPESRVDGTRLVDTRAIADVDDVTSLGLEGAWLRGPVGIQAEYMTTSIGRAGAPSPRFGGFYVSGSWFLTGHARRYTEGVFAAPRVEAMGWGALELGARYSSLDLDDGAIAGGTMDNVTLGLNWYPRPVMRFMANYVIVRSRREGVADEPRILQFRAQFSY